MTNATSTPTPTCPVCGSPDRRAFLEVRGYAIVECLSCTHAYVEAMPTEEELVRLYANTAESFLGSGLAGPMAEYLGDDDARYFAFYADRLSEFARAGAERDSRILDFGCSQGAFVATLAKKGFRHVSGFDLSESSVAEGRGRWNLDLHTGSFDDFARDRARQFDVVHTANVLEHVPDPAQLLVRFRRLLAPGGKLLVSVPNTRSLQVRLAGTRSPVIDPPHHLQYYGPESLKRLVTSAGFGVVSTRTEFWSPASDLYLNVKGLPMGLCRAIRHGMAVPGYLINALSLGGVVSLRADANVA